jgi:hypothetical protein
MRFDRQMTEQALAEALRAEVASALGAERAMADEAQIVASAAALRRLAVLADADRAPTTDPFFLGPGPHV